MKLFSLFAAAIFLYLPHSFGAEHSQLMPGIITIIKLPEGHGHVICMPTGPEEKQQCSAQAWQKLHEVQQVLATKGIEATVQSDSQEPLLKTNHYKAPRLFIPTLSKLLYFTHEGLISPVPGELSLKAPSEIIASSLVELVEKRQSKKQ